MHTLDLAIYAWKLSILQPKHDYVSWKLSLKNLAPAIFILK